MGEKITITAEKGRLSEEDIERMVREAEEFADEDMKVKERVDARNGLEGYAFNLKNMMDDEEKGLADKLDEDGKDTIETAIQEALDWLDENMEAETEEYQEQQKSLEKIVNPIIQKVYQESGGAPPGGDFDEDADVDDFGHEEL